MNYYTLLQVPPTATEKEIRKAYRTLAKMYHPDRLQQATPNVRLKGEEKLKQINLAYAILSHPAKRRHYDATLHSQNWTHSYTQTRRTGTTGPRQRQQAQNSQKSRTQRRQATRAEAHRRLAQVRSEYLRYRAELTAVERHLIAWVLAYGKVAGLVGAVTSLGTAVSLTLLIGLLQGSGLTLGLGTAVWATGVLFVVQFCAVLLVVEQGTVSPKPELNLRSLTQIGGTVFFSLYMVNALSNVLLLASQTSFLPLFGVIFLAHGVSCLLLSQEWIKPILADRQQLETKIAAAEEVMNYWKESLSHF